MRLRHVAFVLSFVLLGTACASRGPARIEESRAGYNEALARTWNEQMLLNLVRLRYRDTPMFLEVTNVSTQYEWVGSLDALASVVEGSSPDGLALGGELSRAERPTVTYTPLQGEQFARQLLSPISIEHLFMLTRSGWRADRVLRCCVKRLDGLWNAPTASGPTPGRPPRYEEFQRAAELLQRLRDAQAFDVTVRTEPGGGESLMAELHELHGTGEALAELRRLLGLPDEARTLRLTATPSGEDDDVLLVEPRSMLGVLFYLSQGVEPPVRDREDGRVTVTRDDRGDEFDWDVMLGDMFHVHSSVGAPADAFVAVRYRDHWFWIDDRDLSSKSTFGLLVQLFNLQAGNVRLAAPLLTLPVGN